ncbi:phospholipase A1-like [Euwallacea similis]|uniref:phospholipase A1-like n=1 Tax=Euwallacea similis TaxID=1736056 RepID=UPI00344E4FAB
MYNTHVSYPLSTYKRHKLAYAFFLTKDILSLALAEDIKDLTPSELLKLIKDISTVPDSSYHLGPLDIQFYFLSRETSEPVLLTSKSYYLLGRSKESKILIHGWLENHKRSWYKAIAEEFLKYNDCNVIEVDWEQPARLPYLHSSTITKDVGNLVGEFIASSKISPKNVHLIGHSLGSHVAGFAGKKVFQDTGMKVGRISGLDPAGPAFRHPSVTSKDRLDKDDAEIVDVLHTDAGAYGYEDPIGTLDIYINGGRRIQPGCMEEWPSSSSLGSIVEKTFCSHARSTKYFKEWISKGKFDCRFCQPILGVIIHDETCLLSEANEVLSANDITVDTVGVCFTETNKEEPYLME